MDNVANLLKFIVRLIKNYWRLDITEFESFEMDQRPEFYLMIATLRPKED